MNLISGLAYLPMLDHQINENKKKRKRQQQLKCGKLKVDREIEKKGNRANGKKFRITHKIIIRWRELLYFRNETSPHFSPIYTKTEFKQICLNMSGWFECGGVLLGTVVPSIQRVGGAVDKANGPVSVFKMKVKMTSLSLYSRFHCQTKPHPHPPLPLP